MHLLRIVGRATTCPELPPQPRTVCDFRGDAFSDGLLRSLRPKERPSVPNNERLRPRARARRVAVARVRITRNHDDRHEASRARACQNNGTG